MGALLFGIFKNIFLKRCFLNVTLNKAEKVKIAT